MNTNKIDLIKADVERLKSQLIKGACASQIAMETRCKEEAYNEVLAILDSLQGETMPKFKAGDHIMPIDSCLGSPRTILEVCDGWYVTDQGTLDFEYEDNWELVEEPAGLDKGKLMDMLEDSLSKETKESWNERLDKEEEPAINAADEALEGLMIGFNLACGNGDKTIGECLEEYKPKIINAVNRLEEPVSDDLEEEVHNFSLHYHGDIVTDEDGIHLCDINESKLLEIARHFANWQKQQMMKDAFTSEVNWYENAVIMCQSLDGFIKEKGWHKGDKVKLILIKDE